MAASALCPRSERVGADLCPSHGGSENKFKRQRQKTVTWPIDQKICEVRHFVVDDAPSSLGPALQLNLECIQGKANVAQRIPSFDIWGAKRAKVEDENVPPGFELSSRAAKIWQPYAEMDVAMAATLPWQQPRKFSLDASWLWAGGEESSEVASQHQRERRFFEAFYPRLASIPYSPLEPQEPSQEIDDAYVAQIPLVPLEEEEIVNEDIDQEKIDPGNKGGVSCMAAGGIKADALLPTSDVHMKQTQESIISIADSNIAAAAAAACMVVKALGESDLVDEKLLLEILKNPLLLKSLTSSNNLTKGKNADQDGCPSTARHIAQQESLSCKLLTDCGAYLNGSPLSVLTQWGDGIDTTITQRLAPIVRTSTHMEQQPTSMSLHPSTWLDTSYTCSNSELSTNLVQEENACTLMEHKQVLDNPKMNAFRRSNQNGASSIQNFGPREEMESKNVRSSNNAPIIKTPSFAVNPASLLSKDLPPNPPVQVEPLKFRSAEASSLSRKTTAYRSMTTVGGRTKRLCLYFNTPRGCRNGESCAFIHQSLGSGANASAQLSSRSTRPISS